MESFRIENLSFTYPNRANKTLRNINITINQGEFITLCGKSGCGKTTLLRLLKPSLAPFGNSEGTIFFENEFLSECDDKIQAEKIGFVMQNPDNQIVTDKVWHELAFGLESLGYKTPEIRMRVSEMASFFGLQTWFYKETSELSGGQKQLLNLASIMAMQPSVLILDEPTSQLDPISAQDFLKAVHKINRELGTTVIISEHRLEEIFPISDRVVVMDEGKITAEGTPKVVAKILKDENHEMYNALPCPMRVYGAVVEKEDYPLTVKEGRDWLSEFSENNELYPEKIPVFENVKRNETVIEIKDAWFRYEKNSPDVIKGLNLKVSKGEIYAIVGGNGTGKTTALSLIAKLNLPYRGKIFVNGEDISKIKDLYSGNLGMLSQNPQSMFVKKTVFSDLYDMLSDSKMPKEEKEDKVLKMASLCKIDNLLESHPYDLSGGEQQRAALSKVLLKNPKILLLDEPTKGMDAGFKEEFADILKELKKSGVTIIMVSHDIEFCAEFADRVALFFDGNITAEGNPREFFAGKNFYTTSANRMAREYLKNAVLAEDIILACGKNPPPIKKKENKNHFIEEKKETSEKKISIENEQLKKKKKTNLKRTVLSYLIILLLVPITIFIGVKFLDNKKYYFISILIIIETMLSFFVAFESRKPRARELVLISALCALAVAGRMAFYSLPQFKPVVALVIISGVCFGGETGFLVGAVTALISNFFFGQGPYTPWQMFAFGIIGFLSGILLKKEFLRKTRVLLCISGFCLTFIIYGGIMNPATVIITQDVINIKMLISSYVTGFAFDLIHAVSTVIFLWFISQPMIDKLERIKIKYGLL